MKKLKIVLFALAFVLTAGTLSAQMTAKTIDGAQTNESAPVLALEEEEENWSFFLDERAQTYYIDFEAIKVTLSEIIVKNDTGEVIFKDEVAGLPVDTIYELDYSRFGSGVYEVELHSYTKVLRRKITVN